MPIEYAHTQETKVDKAEPEEVLEQPYAVEVIQKEHVFWLFRGIVDPLARELQELNKRLSKVLFVLERSLHFVDTPVSISANVAYEVDYHERHMLFAYTTSAVTFVLATGGTLGPTTPFVWFNVSVPRGTRLSAQGVSDLAPIVVTFRATDVSMV